MAWPTVPRGAWIPLLAALLAPAPEAQDAAALEDYLARARLERQALHARLAPLIEPLLAGVRASETPPGEARVNELAALGAEATPLLVAHLDPGAEAEAADVRVADFVARALERMAPAPVAADLLHLLAEGSPAGRLRAARALGYVTDAAQVRPALRATFDSAQGPLRPACLRSLLLLGGPENAALLADVLQARDDELVAMALAALTETGDAACAAHVARLLADPEWAVQHALGLVGYYRALPELAGDEVVDALVGVARGTAPSEVKLAVLAALPEFGPRLASLRRGLAPLAESRDRDLREAALAALATLGDRGARRQLLKPYDDVIDRNKRWSEAWTRRAAVHLRIRDYDAAIRDFKESLDLEDGDRGTFVGLARCYALKGKPREAADWLRRGPSSLEELRALANDPDFAALRDSKWGPEALALEETP